LHKLIVLQFKAFSFCSTDTQYSLKDFPASVILFNLLKMFSIDFLVDSGCKDVISLSVPIMYTINSVLLSAADEDE